MRAILSLLLAAALTLLSAGCGSCGSVSEACKAEIRFETPKDGDVISWDADQNPNRTGLQIEVVASVSECVDESSPVTLLVNEDMNRAREAFIQEGMVVFEQVTLTPRNEEGQVDLQVILTDGASGETDSQTITVSLQDVPSVDCVFLAPTDGAVLGPEDDVQPERFGVQYDVTIQCADQLDGTPASLTVDGVTIPSSIFVDEVATFPAVHLSEGENILAGRVTTEAGTWEDSVRVTVDTPDCEVRLDPSGSLVFNLDGDPPRVPGRQAIADADGDPATGIQADLGALTPDCMGGVAALIVDGEEVASALVEGELVDFGRLHLPDGNDVKAYVTVDPAGEDEGPRGRSVTHSFWVDSVRPAPVLLYPGDGGLLRGDVDKDGDPSNGVQVDMVIEAPDLESHDNPSMPWRAALIEAHITRTDAAGDGDTETLACLVGIDGCEDPDHQGRYRIEMDLDIYADYEIEVVVTDPAGNVGADGPSGFSVDARPLDVAIVSPEADSLVNLEFEGVEDSRVPVTVESESTDVVGANVRVSCTGVPSATGTMGDDLTGVVMMDFSDVPCGGRETTCSARVTVGGVHHHSPEVTFEVDLVPPSLTIVEPSEDDIVFETDMVVEVVTSCLQDGRDVTIHDESGVIGSAAAAAGVADVPVTLSGGEQTIWAAASNEAGNAGQSEAVTFVVASDPPEVVFQDPTDGRDIFDIDDVDPETDGLQYNVRVRVLNEPEGTPVTLQVGYSDGESVVWRAPAGTSYTSSEPALRADFSAVTLPEGEIALRAVATGSHGLRGEAVVWPNVQTGAAVCNIVSPVDGASIGPAHDPDASVEDGVRHDVRVRTDLEDGAEVVLELTDARGDETTLTASVEDGQAVFEDVVFVTEDDEPYGRNMLRAECGEDGRALTTEVDVDLESPDAVILTPEDGRIFNADSSDAGTQEGFQVHFRGTAVSPSTGEPVAEGASAELSVSCGGAEPEIYPLTLLAYGTEIQARARPVLEDQTTCELTFSVTDMAGNESEPVSVTVTVDRVPPEVEILWPEDGRLFGLVYDKGENVPGFQQDVEAAYSGLEEGQPVRLLFRRLSEGDEWVEAAEHLVGSGTMSGFTFAMATYTMEDQDDVTVRVEVEDAAGNIARDQVSVSIDTLAPEVEITRPEWDGRCWNLIRDFDKDSPGVHTQVEVQTSGVAEGLPLTLCGTGRDEGDECGHSEFSFIDERPVMVSEGVGRAVFPAVLLMEGEQELMAEVRDLAGNYSRSEPVIVCADSIPPEVTSFVVPADTGEPEGYINKAESDAVGGDICFELEVEGAEGRELTLYTSRPESGTVVGTGIVEEGEVTICRHVDELGQGSHALRAYVEDENGNPNIRSANPLIENPEAERLLIIDTTPPSLSISSPPALVNADHAGEENVDPTVDFNVTSNAAGREVVFHVGGDEVGRDVVEEGSAGIQVTLANDDTHTLAAEVSDAAGNVTTAEREVRVDTTPPVVTILSPEDGAMLNESSIEFVMEVTGAETGEDLRLYRWDGSAWEERASAAVSGEPEQTIVASVSDGESTWMARAWDAAGNIGESDPVSIEVETEGCSLEWITPSSTPRVFNMFDDEGADPSVLETTVVARTADCGGLTIELYKNETELVGTQASSETTGEAEFVVTLDDGEAGTMTARIEDAFTNVTETSFEFSVDITPPVLTRLPPDGHAEAPAAIAYVHETNPTLDTKVDGYLRLAAMDYEFDTEGAAGGTLKLLLGGDEIYSAGISSDEETVLTENLGLPQKADGVLEAVLVDSAGNEATDSHDVKVDVIRPAAPTVTLEILDDRRATLGVTWTGVGDDGTQGEPEEIEIRWDTSEISGETSYAAANEGARLTCGEDIDCTQVEMELDGGLTPLPPLNTYWVAVRARDELDNVSPLVAAENLLPVENMWNEVVLEGDESGTWYGYTMVPHGVDLNDDGYDDLIVSAMGEDGWRGAVYIYYGGPDPTDLTLQKLVGEQGGELFGREMDAGDVTGDGTPDLLIGAPGFNPDDSNLGRAFLYFGEPGAEQIDESERVEFRGTPGSGGRFGQPVSVLGDIDGTGARSLAIAARLENGVGHVYIFFGRSRSEWHDLAEDLGYVPTSSADVVLVGVEDAGEFGSWRANVNLGPLDGEDGDGFLIPAQHANKGYVFRASDVLSETESPNYLYADEAWQVLEGEGDEYGFDGFMAHLHGDQRHLVVSAGHGECDAPCSVRVYSMNDDGVDEPPVQIIQETAYWFGHSVAHGDITGDGLPDLLVGSNSATNSRFFLFANTGNPAPYSSSADSVIEGSGHLGVSLWVGDINGNGNNEVAAGASTGNRLHIWWAKDHD